MVLILSYLVLETSFCMKEPYKNFRSLFAYNHMEWGVIRCVLGQIIRDKYVIVARVRHSQRVNDPHIHLSDQTDVCY